MRVNDATLGMIAMTSKVVGSIAYGLAPDPLYFYICKLRYYTLNIINKGTRRPGSLEVI